MKCDEGYPCEVCSEYVHKITQSDLYLRFVIGQIDPETLHTTPERHIRCNPALAQYICVEGFEPVSMEGPFDKRQLDPAYVAEREQLVSKGYLRLKELARQGGSILDYPIEEAKQLMRKAFGDA